MKKDLMELSISELVAFYDALDRGLIEEPSTDQLWWHYNNSVSHSDEAKRYRKKIDERNEKLQRIKDAIKKRASDYDY